MLAKESGQEGLILNEEQGGRCACCGEFTSFSHGACLDHDHRSGVVRAVLCRRCNLMVGICKEDVNNVTAVIRYLKKYSILAKLPELQGVPT